MDYSPDDPFFLNSASIAIYQQISYLVSKFHQSADQTDFLILKLTSFRDSIGGRGVTLWQNWPNWKVERNKTNK